MDFLNFMEKLKILIAKEDKEYFKIVISRLIPFKKEKGKLAERHVAF